MQIQRVNTACCQRPAKRDNQYPSLYRLACQRHIRHRHTQSSCRRIQRQFIEVEGDVPVIIQRFTAIGRQPLSPIIAVRRTMQQRETHQVFHRCQWPCRGAQPGRTHRHQRFLEQGQAIRISRRLGQIENVRITVDGRLHHFCRHGLDRQRNLRMTSIKLAQLRQQPANRQRHMHANAEGAFLWREAVLQGFQLRQDISCGCQHLFAFRRQSHMAAVPRKHRHAEVAFQ
ncbi:hypothetical protein D3C84_713700 [compost metagenome]